jgi:YidC/Oxa1 family membrane protein insertase
MSLINDLIGTPLGYLMYWCYSLIPVYAAAILLFTLITKIILFPFSLLAQRNSIKMVRMAPELEDIKRYNSGNGELIAQDIRALYKKEKYSTVAGILPLLVQIPIILGLINVIYNPLQHLLQLRPNVILGLTSRAAEILGVPGPDLGFAGQMITLEEIRRVPEAFADVLNAPPAIDAAMSLDMNFFGINLAEAPSLLSISVIIPVISALSALALSLVQNRFNVLQQNTSFAGRWGMTIFLVAFSAYFASVLPGGLGLYWTFSNLLSIPVLGVCNLIYDPKKYIDKEAVEEMRKAAPPEKKAADARKKILSERSKKDLRRFFSKDVKRELVFYSEGSGFHKYFKGYIDYILKNSDIVIHYVTSDPGDKIFDMKAPRLKPYFINDKDLVALFMKMDADIFVMTTPDLDKYHLVRSMVRKDVEYIYTDHHMTSLHLVLRESALDHFDTVFLSGPNREEEIRQTEYIYNLPQKTLVETGYALLDDLLERVAAQSAEENDRVNDRKKILVAPSWQRDNLLDYCLPELIDGLSGNGWDITIRPHPEFVKRFPNKIEKIEKAYADRLGKDIRLETDFSSNESIYTADVVVTDWSTIAQDFSYTTKKPAVFINTPMKVMNPNYERIPLVPLDISLRDEIGVSVEVSDLDGIDDICEKLILEKDEWAGRITEIVEKNIYNIGSGAKNGAEYIIRRIEYKRTSGAA